MSKCDGYCIWRSRPIGAGSSTAWCISRHRNCHDVSGIVRMVLEDHHGAGIAEAGAATGVQDVAGLAIDEQRVAGELAAERRGGAGRALLRVRTAARTQGEAGLVGPVLGVDEATDGLDV